MIEDAIFSPSTCTQISVEPLRELIYKPLQFLRLLDEKLHACLSRITVRVFAQARILHGLAHHTLPGRAFPTEQRGELVLDLPAGPGTPIAKRGVQLDSSRARAGKLKCIRARRNAAASDERYRCGKQRAQCSQSRKRMLLQRRSGEASLLLLVR